MNISFRRLLIILAVNLALIACEGGSIEEIPKNISARNQVQLEISRIHKTVGVDTSEHPEYSGKILDLLGKTQLFLEVKPLVEYGDVSPDLIVSIEDYISHDPVGSKLPDYFYGIEPIWANRILGYKFSFSAGDGDDSKKVQVNFRHSSRSILGSVAYIYEKIQQDNWTRDIENHPHYINAFSLAISKKRNAIKKLKSYTTLEHPHEIEKARASDMLLRRDYEEIERLLSQYVTLQDKTADGLTMYDAFHEGVSSCVEFICNGDPNHPNWKKVRKNIDDWMKRYPDSIFARLADASYYRYLAWDYRGYTYASKVSDEQWDYFRFNLDKSVELLKNLEHVKHKHPYWYKEMIGTLLDSKAPSSTIAEYYYVAVESYPQYIALYFQWARLNSSKWRGSMRALDKVSRTAAQETRKDLGDTLYTRMWWSAKNSKNYTSEYFDWPMIKSGFERINQDYPHAWNLQNFARFACRVGDHKTFEMLDAKMKSQIHLKEIWGSTDYRYKTCLREMAYLKNYQHDNLLSSDYLACGYKKYSTHKEHKAFLLSNRGSYITISGKESSKEAVKAGLKKCRKSVQQCDVLDVDGILNLETKVPDLTLNCCEFDNVECDLAGLEAKAKKGDDYAMTYLGYKIIDNRHVVDPKFDLEKAVYWLRESIHLGNKGGYNQIGFAYEKGAGVEKNDELAIEWFRLSAAEGDEYAKDRIEQYEKVESLKYCEKPKSLNDYKLSEVDVDRMSVVCNPFHKCVLSCVRAGCESDIEWGCQNVCEAKNIDNEDAKDSWRVEKAIQYHAMEATGSCQSQGTETIVR